MDKKNKSATVVQSSIRFRPDLKKRVDYALVERETTLQAAIDEALEDWLIKNVTISQKSPSFSDETALISLHPPDVGGEATKFIEQLTVLREAANAITRAVELCLELIHGQSASDPGESIADLRKGIQDAKTRAERTGRTMEDGEGPGGSVPTAKRKPRKIGGGGHR